MIRKLIALVTGEKKSRYRYRSAITGRIVTKTYAEAFPDWCVRERL